MTLLELEANVELILYRDGKQVTAQALYPARWYVPCQWSYSLYPLVSVADVWSAQFSFEGEAARAWLACRVNLADAFGGYVGYNRPALLYIRPWHVPSVVVFPDRERPGST